MKNKLEKRQKEIFHTQNIKKKQSKEDSYMKF